MPRKPSTPTAAHTPDTATKSGANAAFRKTKEDRRTPLTHEQITNDLAAFKNAGGVIEVLGTTIFFKSGGTHASAGVRPQPPAKKPA